MIILFVLYFGQQLIVILYWLMMEALILSQIFEWFSMIFIMRKLKERNITNKVVADKWLEDGPTEPERLTFRPEEL